MIIKWLPPIPPGWQAIATALDGYVCQYRYLKVSVSAILAQDDKRWLHVSISRKGGWYAGWEDVKMVKNIFIGRDKIAFIMLLPADSHSDLNEIHHLWHCLDGNIIPDFICG